MRNALHIDGPKPKISTHKHQVSDTKINLPDNITTNIYDLMAMLVSYSKSSHDDASA